MRRRGAAEFAMLGTVTEISAAALPGTFREAVRAEFRRAFRSPYEAPLVVVGNGALMTALWILVPANSNVLFTWHGTLAYPVVLASWMYSDVPATNVLGSDARRGIAALADPAALRRLLLAKNAVLWLLVAPLCAVVAVGFGVAAGRPLATAFSVLWIVVVPLGALGVSCWLGIRWPYHPMALTRRWAHRRPWRRMIVRWLVLVLAPYGLVPALTVIITIPTVVLWTVAAPDWTTAGIPDDVFAWGAVVACAVAVAVWIGGIRAAPRLAQRRRDRLTRFLADPDRG